MSRNSTSRKCIEEKAVHKTSTSDDNKLQSTRGVSLSPSIPEHRMMPWTDLRRCESCNALISISDGYYCKTCDIILHKKCGYEDFEIIQRQSFFIRCRHTSLRIQRGVYTRCTFCWRCGNLTYVCEKNCGYRIDLYCLREDPPEFIENSEMHGHKLTFVRKQIVLDCSAKCGKTGDGFHYKCDECDIVFHVDCVWFPPGLKHSVEVNHSYHSLHPLKLLTCQPEYSDGKCSLCGRKIGDGMFYHCSSCKFNLDMRCVINPPPQSLLDLKTHDHQLTLFPRLDYFTCSVCGQKGDRSPYICIQCDFVIHQDCLARPRVININRHVHRISRTYVLGVVNSECGVCRKKVDWSRGGYSCQKCPTYVVHSKCATRKDVWNGKELEDVPEETEDVEPYVAIDANTIHHFSHEHYLRLNDNGFLCEDNKRCKACTQTVSLTSFYGCTMDCDFILHKTCANFPRRKWHVLHNEKLTLVTSNDNYSQCEACGKEFNGFMYQQGEKKFDVLCGAISEPFFHRSHPDHPLYYFPRVKEDDQVCNACNIWTYYVLRCIEEGCEFCLDFGCATLPQVVKHRVHDHPLSLRYGEKASGKYWCDICEKETNPETWFYTCQDHQASLHTNCVLGDTTGFMPRSIINPWDESYEVVLNDSVSRPLCTWCKSHCMYPIIMKLHGTSGTYFCSWDCLYASLPEYRWIL